VHFEVSPPKESSEVIAKSIATINNKTYSTDQVIMTTVISKQQVLEPAEAKFIKLDLKTNGQKNWLYYGGAVTRFLKVQMGYKVSLLSLEK
jgi:hypothetical protein